MSDAMFQDLFGRARAGRSEGYADLAVRAVASGEAGGLPRSAGLAHGMVWSRLAVSVEPNITHLSILAGILARYALDVGQRGFVEHSVQLGAQALYRFEQAAGQGDEEAVKHLAATADVLPVEASQLAAEWQRSGHSVIIAQEDDCLRGAARGDPGSLGDLFDIALDGASDGDISHGDVVAMLDVIGVLGKATNEARMVARYAGVLLMRSAYLRALHGPDCDHWHAEAEAIALLNGLVAKNEMGALEYLRAAISVADQRAVAAVAKDQPSMLGAIDHKGTC